MSEHKLDYASERAPLRLPPALAIAGAICFCTAVAMIGVPLLPVGPVIHSVEGFGIGLILGGILFICGAFCALIGIVRTPPPRGALLIVLALNALGLAAELVWTHL